MIVVCSILMTITSIIILTVITIVTSITSITGVIIFTIVTITLTSTPPGRSTRVLIQVAINLNEMMMM